jgi:rod shape-determining protein MreB
MNIVGNVGGRDVTVGNLSEIELSQAELAEALHDVVQQIVEVVSRAIGHAGAEIASDIINHGLVITGGGALLRDIDTVLRNETGLPVQVAPEPLTCVALGAARALEDPEYRAEFVSVARFSV